MDFETAQNWWDSLNHLYKTDKEAYDKFVQTHMEKLYNTKFIKPKFGFCVATDAEKISMKTKFNQYTEKLSEYYVYIYHSDQIKASILSEEDLKNVEAINFNNIYISVSKIKGDSNKNLYAEAVVHSDLFKHMINNISLKNKIIIKILETVNKHENASLSNILINTKKYRYVEISDPPKTQHYLNPECVCYNPGSNDQNIQTTGENESNYFGIPKKDIMKLDHELKKFNEQRQKNKEEEEAKKELKLYNCCPGVVSDLQSVQTFKKCTKAETKIHVPKQIQSYYYRIVDGFLNIILTFKDITYNDLEIIKKNNNVRIFASRKSDECMSLNFNENLTDNVKAYFNERLIKLIISIELV